jgi:hypothetical protein
MSGLKDGVSKLWVMRRDTGLDLSGFKDECEAIDHLVRAALLKDIAKEKIQDVVAKALTHMDPTPRECNRHKDCDAADAKAKEKGRLGAEHCHDECCDDCFGS